MFAVDDADVYIGRRWSEFLDFLRRIVSQLSDTETLVILVHNLSYEFHFLRGIYDFTAQEIFAVKPRKVAKCSMFGGKLEFRDTYLHSNMSLAEYTKKMRVQHVKQSGDAFDYSIKRYPDTPLTPDELKYCCHDVVGLVEAYKAEMEMEADTVATIPMTSTGYVRRDYRAAMQTYSHAAIYNAQPDVRKYAIMRAAFRGGDTHANRYFVGDILTDVQSYDRSSSYPDVICNDIFPLSRGIWAHTLSNAVFRKWLDRPGYLFFCTIAFTGLTLKNRYYGFPYIPLSRCLKISSDFLVDNGRILEAGYIELSMTNIDFEIIQETYNFKMEVKELLYYRADKLPDPFIETTQEYYRDKTELKNISGQEVFYTKQKNKLNASYGMCAQDPVRMQVTYNPVNANLFDYKTPNVEKTLNKNRRTNFLLYQWGCFVTAWARYRLYEGIKIAGENAVYVDTDSVKFIGNADFSAFNQARIEASTKSGSFAVDKHGETHFMGVYEQEQTYSRFLTYGSKKYAYEYADGQTHVTIAGVNKKKGGEELHRRGGLEALKEGFTFVEAGGVEAVYNDSVQFHTEEIDGHTIEMTPNVCLRPSTYTLTLTSEYKDVLQFPYLWELIKHRFGINPDCE